MKGPLRVRKHKFGGFHKGPDGIHSNTTYRWHVRGRLGRHGKARGSLRVSSTDPNSTCYSAGFNWKAKRGAEITTPNP